MAVAKLGVLVKPLYSQSLIARPMGVFAGEIIIPDPTYGPVIRLTPCDTGGLVPLLTDRILIVHLAVMEPKDEDRDPTGSV